MKPEWLAFFTGLVVILFGSAFFVANASSIGAVAQPIAFKHIKHASLECTVCHQSVKDSPSAGIPQAQVCMSCHNKPVTQNPEAMKIKSYFDSGQPIPWVRMFSLADDVIYSHKIHVGQQGIDCKTCHGNIAAQQSIPAGFGRKGIGGAYGPPLMEFCLSCHREEDAKEPGRDLTDCLTCHK